MHSCWWFGYSCSLRVYLPSKCKIDANRGRYSIAYFRGINIFKKRTYQLFNYYLILIIIYYYYLNLLFKNKLFCCMSSLRTYKTCVWGIDCLVHSYKRNWQEIKVRLSMCIFIEVDKQFCLNFIFQRWNWILNNEIELGIDFVIDERDI